MAVGGAWGAWIVFLLIGGLNVVTLGMVRVLPERLNRAKTDTASPEADGAHADVDIEAPAARAAGAAATSAE